MHSVALILILYIIAGSAFVLGAARTAPEGYEDENGFHYGKEPDSRRMLSTR